MKLKHILKIVGLISALSFSSIAFVSCDDDGFPASTETVDTSFDFSTYAFNRSLNDHPYGADFSLSASFSGNIEGGGFSEGFLVHSSDVAREVRSTIQEFVSRGGVLQSLRLSEFGGIELAQAYYTGIDTIISTGGSQGNQFTGDEIRAARDKSLNNLSLTVTEARILSSLYFGSFYDSSGNLFIIDTIDIDFTSGTYLVSGQVIRFDTADTVVFTGATTSVAYNFTP